MEQIDIWQGLWVGVGVQKTELGLGPVMFETALKHPHGNAKEAVRCMSLETRGEI